jgi:hypothetical protein
MSAASSPGPEHLDRLLSGATFQIRRVERFIAHYGGLVGGWAFRVIDDQEVYCAPDRLQFQSELFLQRREDR